MHRGFQRHAMVFVAIVFAFSLLASPVLAEAPTVETICVKYGPCPLNVSTFTCVDTPRSSFARRICYDAPKAFMVSKLNETWYPYCEIDADFSGMIPHRADDIITTHAVTLDHKKSADRSRRPL
jgi:hypothetical protein